MAYLVDFLKCLPSGGRKDEALASSELKEWEKLRKECDMMLERGYFHGKRPLSDPEILAIKKARRLRDTVWKRFQFIPSQMCKSVLGSMDDRTRKILYSQDNVACCLAEFVNFPRVELSEIREAAAKMSYMIVPISYMTRKTKCPFSDLRYEIGSVEVAIQDIGECAGVEHDLYALCPIRFYDICRVEKETEQREVIFGGELVQIKVLLDTITQIQRNLFALLTGNEAYTNVWEIGEGCGCSENELTHLRILVETIMPIQRSLMKIVRESEGIKAWEEEMQKNHCERVSKILQETVQRLSWSEEARSIIERTCTSAKPGQISEVAVAPDVLFFALRRGVSLIYGDEPAIVVRNLGMNMPESFYLNRGFTRQSNEGLNVREVVSRFSLY